ncbi:hypothetical protein ACHAWU_001034 [Discostella pseudostelligera]|uniref:Inositol oxygenase n=1 Tax=Discostella pseudostelligera TaxID=259834 RepID=A0ABD3MH24_9STRA
MMLSVNKPPAQCQHPSLSAQSEISPLSKRARRNTKSWKEFVVQNVNHDGKLFGLRDMFGHGFSDSDALKLNNCRGSQSSAAAASSSLATTRCIGTTTANDNNIDQRAATNKFYTLRMEHRQGGPLAKHRGEERILLFRSDRAGIIAKIIFSSEPPENTSKSVHSKTSVDVGDSSVDDDAPNPHFGTAYAKIHVLEVKSQYRGRDLGGLLFSEALSSLKSRYCNDDDWGDNPDYAEVGPVKSNGCKRKDLYNVECMLDAEEDVTRYGKLESFYQQLGCFVKCPKRIQYVNNNDTGTYRKIPMQINLRPSTKSVSSLHQERTRLRRQRFFHLTSYKRSFLPVQLVGSLGKLTVRSHAGAEVLKMDWLATETSEGIQFCSTHGHVLLATPNGSVCALTPKDQDNNDCNSVLDCDASMLNKWTLFVPCRASDGSTTTDVNDQSRSVSTKSLWALRTCHGTFLTADPIRQTLACTRLPSFWQANGSDISLQCTSDTPSRRHHYRKCTQLQTYDYVLSMRSRFLNFCLGGATLFEALGWIHAFPAHPFRVCSPYECSKPSSSPSMRTFCFLMAETARDTGLPDWVQLIALFHGVGEAVKVLDPSNTGDMAESIYDWTISSRSRIVGCKIPQRATSSFGEFRPLNVDEEDPRFNSDIGAYQAHCGLENVLLMWSGCEYVYYLLRHNHATLPDEAFAMLRYFLLVDWHAHHDYSSLTNDIDDDMLPFVQEFVALRRRVKLSCVDCGDLTDHQCNFLWDIHYANVAAKYNCDHMFDW